jgi:hypothetical protein
VDDSGETEQSDKDSSSAKRRGIVIYAHRLNGGHDRKARRGSMFKKANEECKCEIQEVVSEFDKCT